MLKITAIIKKDDFERACILWIGDNQSGSAITDISGRKPSPAYNACETFLADNGNLIASIKQ